MPTQVMAAIDGVTGKAPTKLDVSAFVDVSDQP
jgi:hypothetical protein